TALTGLLPATTNVCTTGRTLAVPLRGPDRFGHFRRATTRVTVRARAGGALDVDRVKLTCVPHGWPMHGYDHANRRATGQETVLGPGNAANLAIKWQLDLLPLTGNGANAVTSTPTVGNGLVYVTSWHGEVYALQP